MIGFNIPPVVGNEEKYIKQAIDNHKICGDGELTKKCSEWMENKFSANKILLTTSCSSALEMAALLVDIQPGDEVIMSPYTFVSTANAFVLRGAKIVFVDIRPDTMNIDENLIEDAITEKTKAIVPVHYAGVACEMNKIMEIEVIIFNISSLIIDLLKVGMKSFLSIYIIKAESSIIIEVILFVKESIFCSSLKYIIIFFVISLLNL